jgi:acyl-CoA hydrolase
LCACRQSASRSARSAPRDGFQNEPERIATADKVRLIDTLARTGHARFVIAEVNDHYPATAGEWIAWERLDAVVYTSRLLLEAPAAQPGPVELRIAERVAAIVEDGDTIQLGVGALPDAILSRLAGHRDLGVHAGKVSDGALSLIEAGGITNARKSVCRGFSVTGAALASEIDLTGQVNAESAGGRRIGAVGGQVDFLRAAAQSGGEPILALPAQRMFTTKAGEDND